MGLKVFLSYGHDANTDLVLRIKCDLEAAGYAPWIDTSEIEHGDDWRRSILDGLSDTDCTLAFLSRHAVREGGVCLDELALAMGIRHGNLATILVEPEAEVQPPVSVSHIQWLDMSGWAAQDDAWYQQKLHAILNRLADPETHRFHGEIEALESLLHPVTQAADIPPLIDGFVGRQWVVQAVEDWRRTAPQRRVFWLTGEPGAGKSAFAAWLAHYQRTNVVCLNLCRWNDEDRSDPRNVLRTLAFFLATRLPHYRRRLLDRFRLHDPQGEELERKGAAAMFHWLLAEPLNLIDGGRRRDRCVLLIDALDETLRDGVSELADLLAELAPKLPAWLALLLTSRPDFPIAASLSRVAPFRLDATDPAANTDDLRLYAQGWLTTLLADHSGFADIVPRVDGVVDALADRIAWRSVLAWLGILDRVAEVRGEPGLPWRHYALRRRADTLATLGQMGQALAAHDAAVAATERAAMAEPDDTARRNDLAAAFMNRGNAKQSAPGHGPGAAITDYDRAIELRQTLRDALGDDWPVPWRNDLAAALMNRGNAKVSAPGHGPGVAIADYDRAIELMQALREALGDDWPVPWRNDLAAAFVNRGNAKQDAPVHGPGAAITDYDRAIEIRQALREALGDDWPVPWRNNLANAFMNRGVAKQSAPGHGPGAAIADYDRAIELMQALREALGDDWPVPWRNDLAAAFVNRGNARQDAPGHGPGAAVADYDRAIALWEALERGLGSQMPPVWLEHLATARRLRAEAEDGIEASR